MYENHKPLSETYAVRMEAYLEEIDCGAYTIGDSFRVEGAWYGAEASAEGAEPFCVFVRQGEDGIELRDDRVRWTLDRQMQVLTDQLSEGKVVCIPRVRFVDQMPMYPWGVIEMLQDVNANDALTTDWYALFTEAQQDEMLEQCAELAVRLGQKGYIGIIHVIVTDESTANALLAAFDRTACSRLAQQAQRIRVNTDSARTKEVILAELSQQ